MSRPVAHQADSQPTGDPPVHFPFRRAADILSRVRSPISSLSNCANESRMFSVSRPSDVLVLNCCVTATKLTLCFSKTLSMRVKSSSDPLSRSTLYTANAIQLARLRRTEQSRQRWPSLHGSDGGIAVPRIRWNLRGVARTEFPVRWKRALPGFGNRGFPLTGKLFPGYRRVRACSVATDNGG